MSKTYAVTGASGQLGRRAIEELVARGVDPGNVIAVVRTPSKAEDLAHRGVQVREGDYSRPETLAPALAGADRVLLVSGTEIGQRAAQHTAVIEAAQAAGCERVVYTSILKADTSSNPLAPEHAATEQVLRTAGLPYTILRNGWYLENYADSVDQYLARGEVLGATNGARISAATRDDFAIAAAVALLDDIDGDRIYELGGFAFTFEDLAAAVTYVTGTTVRSQDLSQADYTAALIDAGMDEATARFVVALDASIARGELETDSEDLARLLGRSPTPLIEALRSRRG